MRAVRRTRLPGIDLSVNDSEPISSDIEVAQGIDHSDIGQSGNGEELPGRESLLAIMHSLMCDSMERCGGRQRTCLQIIDSYSTVSNLEIILGWSGSGGALLK